MGIASSFTIGRAEINVFLFKCEFGEYDILEGMVPFMKTAPCGVSHSVTQ